MAKLADRKHPAYEDNVDKWDQYYNAADGGDSFINRTNLFTHRLEDTEDYEERLERAYFLNFCELIPNLYNDYIFKERIGRPPDSDLEAFRINTDRNYNDISHFISTAGFYSKVYGVIHVLIDAPAKAQDDALAKKLTEAQATDIYPYCSIIHPQDLVDWSLDADGNFNWVIIRSDYYDDSDPEKERDEKELYKLITKKEWRIEDENGETPKFEDGRPTSGSNGLGIVPVITLYNKSLEDNKIGKSILKDVYYINRIIFNWCSCIDEQIERQTFSQLVVPDSGELADESESGNDPLYEVGTSSIWTFPADAANPPQFISPDVDNINAVWSLIVDHVKEIFRITGLLGASEDMYVSRSGRAAQMGFMSVNSALAKTAKLYEKFENEISIIAKLFINETSVKDYEYVVYPKSFDLEALSEQIDSHFKIMERNMSPTLNKFMQKDIARRSVPLASASIKEQIEKEIDDSDGIVEPLKGAWTELENDVSEEDGNPNSNQGKTFRTKKQLETEETSHRKEE